MLKRDVYGFLALYVKTNKQHSFNHFLIQTFYVVM